jgi:hypothetical protein
VGWRSGHAPGIARDGGEEDIELKGSGRKEGEITVSWPKARRSGTRILNHDTFQISTILASLQ